METYRSGHNGADSKSVCGQPHVGSNPTVSAKRNATHLGGFLSFIWGCLLWTIPWNDRIVRDGTRLRCRPGMDGNYGVTAVPTFCIIGHIQLPSISLRMRLKVEGHSHGLKSVHRDTFCTSLRTGAALSSPIRALKNPDTRKDIWIFLVREMGLEPTRRLPHAPQT